MVLLRRNARDRLSRRAAWGVGLAVAAFVGLALLRYLYPEKPRLRSNAGVQEEQTDYQARVPGCYPPALNHLPRLKRLVRAEACEEAKEQHRESTNSFIESARASDAANASAIIGYEQTRIYAWAALLSFITMGAAILAAFFAKRAANETKRGADASRRAAAGALQSARAALSANRHARDAHAAEMRPWIGVFEVEVVGPVTFNSKEAICPCKLVIKNFGKSPAKGVKLFTHWMPHTDIGEIDSHFSICRIIDLPQNMGVSIFPGDQLRLINEKGIVPAQYMGKSSSPEGTKRFFTPTILIEVIYGDFNSSEVRTTKAVFQLVQNDKALFIDDNFTGELSLISADKLAYMAVPHGWYAD